MITKHRSSSIADSSGDYYDAPKQRRQRLAAGSVALRTPAPARTGPGSVVGSRRGSVAGSVIGGYEPPQLPPMQPSHRPHGPPPPNPYRELRFEQFPEPPETVASALPAITLPQLPVVAMPASNISATALAVTVAAANSATALANECIASLSAPRLYTLGADGTLIVLSVVTMTKLYTDNAPSSLGVISTAAVSVDGGRVALATAMPMSLFPVVVCPGNSLSRSVGAMLDVPGAAARRIKLNSPRKQAQGAALNARKVALDPTEAKRIAQV